MFRRSLPSASTFRCRPCDILWLTQPEPIANAATDDEAEPDHDADHDPDADGYDGEESVDGRDPFEQDSMERATHDETERKP